MKIYRNLVDAVARTLQLIFTEGRHADKAIEHCLKSNPQWGSRDRRFVAEGVYDVVRNMRLYTALAGSLDNFWMITGVWLSLKHNELPDWPEFKHLDQQQIQAQYERFANDPPVYYSYPDWLWKLGEEELGAEVWNREAIAMHQQAPVYLRVNTLKANRKQLTDALALEQIPAIPVSGIKTGLELERRVNVFQNRLFKDGWFEVQDAGSQAIGEFVDPQPGEFVIDACAGAGGKSLHMAAIMQNKGRILSTDIELWKLEELKRRVRRAGVSNLSAAIMDQKVLKQNAGKADRVLLDVPCSGLGVLKRNPDAKWKLSLESIERTKSVQREILDSYSRLVKSGGRLFYSTCSLLASENEKQTEDFVTRNAGFRITRQKALMPSGGTDGFYMCELFKD